MSDDPKVDFYLENRSLIEEWSKLRAPAARALDQALLAAAQLLGEDEDIPEPQITEDRARTVRLHVTADPLPKVWLELWWEERNLLKGAGGWPTLIIAMNPKYPRPVRDAVKNATGAARDAHGMNSTGKWWLRYGAVTPEHEPVEIDAYAQHCMQRLRDAWSDLHTTIVEVVEKNAPR